MNKEQLFQRASFKSQIRAFLQERGVLEVDVPLLFPAVCPDSCVEPIALSFSGQKLYLQPSPELNLKKIVAQHQFDCYSLNYAYRADPSSPIHHPEFLMLEFYLMGQRYDDIRAMTAEIVAILVGQKSVRTRSYQEIWQAIFQTSYIRCREKFIEILNQKEIDFDASWDISFLEDVLFGRCIQPTLGQGIIDIIDGFPLHQSALAVVVGPDRAARYEVFFEGMEVANGYDELSGGELNRMRFIAWQEQRKKAGLDLCEPLDELFFEAMDQLPRCSGVAIGIDRLFMKALECTHLNESIPFYWA